MNTQQMNTEMVKKNWIELKGKIKSKWSKFNDEEVDSVKSDLTQLSGKIQKVYGIAKDVADRQFDEFKTSVKSLIDDAPKSAVASPVAAAPAHANGNIAAASSSAEKPAAPAQSGKDDINTVKDSKAV